MASENLIYGLHVIDRLLATKPEQVLIVYIANEREDSKISNIIAAANQHRIAVERVSKKQLGEWLNHESHQGVAAKIRPTVVLSQSDLMDLLDNTIETPLLLILDGVLDPHNLGACMRTALAAAVTAIIIPKDRAVSLTPTVRKVASGAADLVSLVEVTNLVRVMDDLKKRGIWIAGASLKADKTLYQTDLKGPIAIILGAEQGGLRRLTEENCDLLMKIPMDPAIESLNVSVATGICLFEALRQRIVL